MLFSQRMGITPTSREIQIDSIDDDLRHRLWNIYTCDLLDLIKETTYPFGQAYDASENFYKALWGDHYKRPVDLLPSSLKQIRRVTRDKYYESNWFQIYNLLEFSIGIIKNPNFMIDVLQIEMKFNSVLQQEFSGYRFINGILAPISNEYEKLEIENALNITNNLTALNSCNVHLTQSLKLLSDKPSPDYRNSIKESISAVESVAKIISGNTKDELGTALSILKEKANLNGGLVAGFKALYGWTSSSSGIRHGLMDEPNCDFDDAKYMLVSCSAFINYLICKAQKFGVNLQ